MDSLIVGDVLVLVPGVVTERMEKRGYTPVKTCECAKLDHKYAFGKDVQFFVTDGQNVMEARVDITRNDEKSVNFEFTQAFERFPVERANKMKGPQSLCAVFQQRLADELFPQIETLEHQAAKDAFRKNLTLWEKKGSWFSKEGVALVYHVPAGVQMPPLYTKQILPQNPPQNPRNRLKLGLGGATLVMSMLGAGMLYKRAQEERADAKKLAGGGNGSPK